MSEFAWGAEDGEPDPAAGGPGTGRLPSRAGRPSDRPQVQAPPIERGDVECTPGDDARMKDLVKSEEERPEDAYFDALFDSLIEYREQENYDLILQASDGPPGRPGRVQGRLARVVQGHRGLLSHHFEPRVPLPPAGRVV